MKTGKQVCSDVFKEVTVDRCHAGDRWTTEVRRRMWHAVDFRDVVEEEATWGLSLLEKALRWCLLDSEMEMRAWAQEIQ